MADLITTGQLIAIMPTARGRADVWTAPINRALGEFGIDTPRRKAAFVAQIAHESGELRFVRELASGQAYDTGRLAARLGNTPEPDGDGQKYKGRGLIQITGRKNYKAASLALLGNTSLLDNPERLEEPELAARSAAWFWWSEGLNALADRPGSFELITRRINGGTNGLASRLVYYDRARRVLGDADIKPLA